LLKIGDAEKGKIVGGILMDNRILVSLLNFINSNSNNKISTNYNVNESNNNLGLRPTRDMIRNNKLIASLNESLVLNANGGGKGSYFPGLGQSVEYADLESNMQVKGFTDKFDIENNIFIKGLTSSIANPGSVRRPSGGRLAPGIGSKSVDHQEYYQTDGEEYPDLPSPLHKDTGDKNFTKDFLTKMSLRMNNNNRIMEENTIDKNYQERVYSKDRYIANQNKKSRGKGGKGTLVTPFRNFRKNPEFSNERNTKISLLGAMGKDTGLKSYNKGETHCDPVRNQANLINQCIQATLHENARLKNLKHQRNEFEQFDDSNLVSNNQVGFYSLDYIDQPNLGRSQIPNNYPPKSGGLYGFQYQKETRKSSTARPRFMDDLQEASTVEQIYGDQQNIDVSFVVDGNRPDHGFVDSGVIPEEREDSSQYLGYTPYFFWPLKLNLDLQCMKMA
jgi:hypothetical protein